MRLRRTIPLLLILAVALGFAAILASRAGLVNLPRKYDPFAVPNLDETPHWLTQTQLKLVDLEPENCAAALARTPLTARLQPTRGAGTACEVERPVTISRLATARVAKESTRCNIAARLYMWDSHEVQPAAMRHFNEPVAEILHFGSYSCRTIAGSSWMSEHAKANAFDISGFKLKSGKLISVLKDWNGTPATQRFLRDVRDGACQYFNMTLSPDYNEAHRDHFHVDMGWLRGCN
jgi:hypothetical protein